MTESGANPGNLVGGHRRAYAAAADQDAAFRFTLKDVERDGFSVIRIIHWTRAVSADVDQFMPRLAKVVDQHHFQVEAGMVRANGDFHEAALSIEFLVFS